MKLFYIFIITVLFLSACSDWGEDEDRFVNAYRDILSIRLIYPDTTVANPKVDKIFKHYGYTAKSFKREFFKYADKPELFNAMLDSARVRASRDYIKLEKKENKKKIQE